MGETNVAQSRQYRKQLDEPTPALKEKYSFYPTIVKLPHPIKHYHENCFLHVGFHKTATTNFNKSMEIIAMYLRRPVFSTSSLTIHPKKKIAVIIQVHCQ